MKRRSWPLLWTALLMFLPSVQVQAQAALTGQVQQLVQAHPAFAGKKVRLEWPVRQPRLPACTRTPDLQLQLEPKTPGWVRVLANCPAGAWQRSFQVRVHVAQRYLAASRNLMPGHVLTADDLAWAEADSAHLGEVATDLQAVIGQELRRPLTRGSPLRLNTLSPLTVIQKGSQVILILRGPGFEIETLGQALNNAAAGAEVKIQLKEGTIITAKAKAAGVAEAQ